MVNHAARLRLVDNSFRYLSRRYPPPCGETRVQDRCLPSALIYCVDSCLDPSMPISRLPTLRKSRSRRCRTIPCSLAARISNLFHETALLRRHPDAGRPDRRGLAAHRRADRLLHRRRAGAANLQHAAAVRLACLSPGNWFRCPWCANLGPVLTGLMVAGRNSSGMASELGSMKVTEQIDAMRAMGVDPIQEAGNAARGRDRRHAVLPQHHLRPGGTDRRLHDFRTCCWGWTPISIGPPRTSRCASATC